MFILYGDNNDYSSVCEPEKQRVPGCIPTVAKGWEGFWWYREVPGRWQRTAEVPLSKVSHPQCPHRALG